MATTRRGDFTQKQYIYKVYDNGFNHKRRDYITPDMFMGWELFGKGAAIGSATISGGGGENSGMYQLTIVGTGDSNIGLDATPSLVSDPVRPANIKSSELTFKREHFTSGSGVVDSYYLQVFDYKIVFDVDAGTVEVFHNSTSLGSDTLSSDYDYIRMYEDGDTFYIENSDDGIAWTSFASRGIDYDSDTTVGGIILWTDISIAGPDDAGVIISELLWLRRDYGFKGVIPPDTVGDDLEFTTQINSPASSTTVKLKQNPLTLPDYIKNGAFIDIYANYWSYLAFEQVDTITDHDGLPMLDHDSQPITGVVTPDLTPERDSWLRFSGYIDSIELDYDKEEVTLGLVSHGEELSNILAISPEEVTVDVLSQRQQNSSESLASFNRRQTFTLDRVQRLSGVTLRVSSSSVTDYPNLRLGTGTTTIADAIARVSTSADEYTFWFENDVELEAGTYWIQITSSGGTITWYYQNTNVFEGGSRQTLSAGVWSSTTTDAYFRLLLNTSDVETQYTSESLQDVVTDLVESGSQTQGALFRNYSQVTLGQVDSLDYNISLLLKMNDSLEAINRVYEQTALGWWWSVDPGTNELTMQAPKTTPDHIFYVGKDILELKLKKQITNIKNDVYFVGGTINQDQDTLTIRTVDSDSIANFRRGLSTPSDGRVLRYDTAQAFSDFEIAQFNGEIVTTSIEIQARTYDIETIRDGDLVTIVNLGGESITLQIASIKYMPLSVNLSLANVPTTLLRNLSATQRSLDNLLTLEADNAI